MENRYSDELSEQVELDNEGNYDEIVDVKSYFNIEGELDMGKMTMFNMGAKDYDPRSFKYNSTERFGKTKNIMHKSDNAFGETKDWKYEVKLGLIDKHYILYEDIPNLTSFYLTRMWDIKRYCEEFNLSLANFGQKITGWSKKDRRYESDKRFAKINSLEAIHTLMDKGYLSEMLVIDEDFSDELVRLTRKYGTKLNHTIYLERLKYYTDHKDRLIAEIGDVSPTKRRLITASIKMSHEFFITPLKRYKEDKAEVYMINTDWHFGDLTNLQLYINCRDSKIPIIKRLGKKNTDKVFSYAAVAKAIFEPILIKNHTI